MQQFKHPLVLLQNEQYVQLPSMAEQAVLINISEAMSKITLSVLLIVDIIYL